MAAVCVCEREHNEFQKGKNSGVNLTHSTLLAFFSQHDRSINHSLPPSPPYHTLTHSFTHAARAQSKVFLQHSDLDSTVGLEDS